MKRYEFRLAAVLRLRHAEEEQAREALAAANRHLRSVILERDAQSARYGELTRAELATTLDGLLAEQQAASLAAGVVASAKRAATNAAAEAALAQVSWTGSWRRVTVLERLDDRRRAEHAEEAQRAEVAVIDDIVTARYVAAHRAQEARSAHRAQEARSAHRAQEARSAHRAVRGAT
jgi:flagellar FliJ protein